MKSVSLRGRTAALLVLALVCLLVWVVRLYQLQIRDGADYLRQSENKLTRTLPVKAPRGELLDRYGRPLVTNRTSFAIQFNAVNWRAVDDKAGLIDALIKLCDAAGQPHIDTLPVSADEPFVYTYEPNAGSQDERNTVKYLEENDWDPSTSAPELIAKMREAYEIPESYTPAQARAVVGVRYEMDVRRFSSATPFLFAQDIDVTLATRIEEQRRTLPCVSIAVESVREYQTTAAAHVLGRTGQIYADEFESLKAQGYRMDDMVGKDGMERVLESILRGQDGTETIETNTTGKITSKVSSVAPVSGKNCVLTLDLPVQAAAEQALAELIPRLREEGKTNSRWGGEDAKGAALVALDVRTGGVLACASYPTFSLPDYSKNYQSMLDDPLKPMFNRAISGLYPPGSTFKMVTALAALESGAITRSTQIEDKGIYTFYKGYQPQCDIYKTYHRTHGMVDVVAALKVSCNYFFYESGRLTGIDNISAMAENVGFGSLTGIELSGERAGQVAGRKTREAAGGIWYDGDTLSAAIGQSDTLVTPLQLASYTAMLASRGTQYQPHLLQSVQDPETNQALSITEPTVLRTLDVDAENLDAVLQGMYDAANAPNGTVYSTFHDYPVKVGAKTGSAQAPGGSHALLVAFAPFDDPEIAVAVIVENGGQGSRIPEAVRAVFDAYFFDESNSKLRDQENSLIQ